jgi:hypothetical protein
MDPISTSPPPAPVPEWPETRRTHPFDGPDEPAQADPDKVLASINEICDGWRARRFRDHFFASLRGPGRVTVVMAGDVFTLTTRIAEVNAGRLA